MSNAPRNSANSSSTSAAGVVYAVLTITSARTGQFFPVLGCLYKGNYIKSPQTFYCPSQFDNQFMYNKPEQPPARRRDRSRYNEKNFELLFRCIEAGQKDGFFKFDMMPNHKTDSNNASGMSTDFIGMNYAYPEEDYEQREKFAAAQELWQRGLLWSLQNHPRVPEAIRANYAKWGLPKDEFEDNGHWPTQLYIREARRMKGMTIATERTLMENSAAHSIGMGVYAIDSHAVQRYADAAGTVHNEGDVQIKPPGPYRIDYDCIVPKAAECDNLIVPVCLSASHVAYGSIRMEPVFMVLGHSAADAANIAIEKHESVQQVSYEELRKELLAEHQVLSK